MKVVNKLRKCDDPWCQLEVSHDRFDMLKLRGLTILIKFKYSGRDEGIMTKYHYSLTHPKRYRAIRLSALS
jgi:hypothetical protein